MLVRGTQRLECVCECGVCGECVCVRMRDVSQRRLE